MKDWFNNLFGKIKDFGYNALSSIATKVGGAFGNALNQWLGTDLGQLANSFGAALNTQGSSILNSITHGGPTGEQLYENAWTAQREDTLAQRTVKDYQAAGLNPALMYGSGPVAQPASSAGVSTPGVSFSDMVQLASLPLQLKVLGAQAANIGADTAVKEVTADKVAEEVVGVKISNEFAAALNQSKLDSQNVLRELNRKQIEEIDSQIRKMDSEVSSIAQSMAESMARERLYDVESDKVAYEKTYLTARTLTERATRDRIAALLPFERDLMSARTENERAAAGLATAQAAYQNGLINNGYIEALCKELNADAAIKEVKAALSNPNFDFDSGVLDDFGRYFAIALGAFLQPFKGILSTTF